MVQAATGTFEETIDTGNAVIIEVSTTAGDVVVQGADVDHVSIRGVIKVNNRMSRNDPIKASNMVRAVRSEPPVEVVDGRIIVGQLKRNTHQRHVEINYVITVPNDSDVTAHSKSGDVRVSGVNGPVNATSESGQVVRADDRGDHDRV
jgi:hypothetical protein